MLLSLLSISISFAWARGDSLSFDCSQPIGKDLEQLEKVELCPASLDARDGSRTAVPLLWLHVPKTGSSFGVTVMHYACPAMPWWAMPRALPGPAGQQELGGIQNLYWRRCWPDIMDGCAISTQHIAGHQPVAASEYDDFHVVTLLRKPSQRLISAYYDGFHDCFAACRKSDPQPSPAEFARWHETHGKGPAGCATKMMNGRSCGGPYPTRREVDSAVARIRGGKLAFVGLTEHYHMSVCMLHAKLGGPATAFEFQNTRYGSGHGNASEAQGLGMSGAAAAGWAAAALAAFNLQDGGPGPKVAVELQPADPLALYDESLLEGYVDWADEELYGAARDIFFQDLQHFYGHGPV